MTEQEAIFEINCHERGMDHESKLFEALECGLTALRAQSERENPKPLTLEELKQRKWKPIFIAPETKDGWWDVLEDVEELKHITVLIWRGGIGGARYTTRTKYYASEPKGAEND